MKINGKIMACGDDLERQEEISFPKFTDFY